MDYAVIKLQGKQYRVREGMTLVVDRLKTDEGSTFTPDVLLGAADATVTVKVLTHERGPKIRIGKYKKRTGYKRHNGYRSAVSRIQIESIGATGKAAPKKAAAPKTESAVEAVAEAPAGLPEGYAKLTVAQIGASAGDWSPAERAAALAHEQEHAKRKGALSALEAAIAKEGDV